MRRSARRLLTICSVVALLLCLAAGALWVRSERVTRHLSVVSAATTPAAERQAFQELSSAAREHRWSVELHFFDATGSPIGPTVPHWQKGVATVELAVNGQRLTHRVLDRDNLFLLMGE